MSALSDLVQEKAAQASCPTLWDDTYPEHLREQMRPMVREQVAAALSVLADPEVLQGITEVLGGAIHGCFDGKPGLYDEPCEQCWTAAGSVVAALTGTKP